MHIKYTRVAEACVLKEPKALWAEAAAAVRGEAAHQDSHTRQQTWAPWDALTAVSDPSAASHLHKELIELNKKAFTVGYRVRLKITLETEVIEHAYGVLGDRLHIFTASGQISNDEQELDSLTFPNASDISQV